MTSKTNILYLAISILFTVLVSGCRTSKPSSVSPEYPIEEGAPAVQASLTPAQRVATLVDSYASRTAWADLNIPVKCTLRSPKSISVSGRLVMVKDKSITLSLRMLGFEVAGLYADRDSIYIYEKINKSLVAEPMSRLTASTGLTLSDIQDLLTGVICYPGEKLTGKNIGKLFDITIENNIIQLTPRDRQRWSYTLSADNLPVLTSAVITSSKVNASCHFSAPQPCGAGSFIPSVSINAEAGKQKLDASMAYTLYDIKANTSPNVSKPSFKGYRRIAMSSLVKALGAF